MSADVYKFEKLIGVGNVELTLDDSQRVYTFIGTNGVGKTKCLEALFQLHFFFKQGLSGNIYKGVFKNAQHNDFLMNSTAAGGLVINIIHPTYHNLVFIGAGLRGRLQKSNSAIDAIGTFEQRRNTHITNTLRQMESDFSILGNEPNGLDSWFVKRAQSANPYQKQKDNREIEIATLLKVLHDIDERFDLDPIQISGDNTVELSINKERKKLSELSSGFASLLKILQAIISGYANITNEVNLTHVRGKVFIDEIESHLHSEWQAKIIPLLKSSFPNTTFFITTHSPIVLTQLSEGEAYQLRRDDDGVVRTHLIPQPNNQLLADLLVNAFSVNLNQLKSKQLENDNQSDVKKMMLDLLGNGEAQWTQRLVMLDANLIISAFDDEAERTPEIRDEAKKAVMALMNDPAVKFVTTPIISYEVLCNARTFENEQKLKRLLNGYKLYEIGDSVANCAVEIFKISRANQAY